MIKERNNMNFIEILLTAVGLSMDAFAVSVTDGLACTNIEKKQRLSIGLCFGFFQGLMPTIGFFLGKAFEDYIKAVDHWIALILLGYIGGKMIYDSIREFKSQEEVCTPCTLTTRMLLMQGVATSIDALAVGVSFAALSNINIFYAGTEIAVITCALSLIGVRFGKKFGQKLGSRATLTGGLILVFLGVKIFIEHMFF